jgi:uncharacterized protein YceH (UPF0502 family)
MSDALNTPQPRALSAHEARVLAVLVEKQLTVPDSYPLSLNALTLGCNQKSAREPVMQLSDDDVLQAIDGLKSLSLVNEVSGSRVVRFEHNAARGLGVPSQAVALLTVLMLRGPQTSAELRLHAERLHRFADVSSVDAFLDELADKTPPRVLRLARAPGEREARWAHLLSGAPALPAAPAFSASPAASAAWTPAAPDGPGSEDWAALRAEQARMREELQALRTLVHRLAGELGVSID